MGQSKGSIFANNSIKTRYSWYVSLIWEAVLLTVIGCILAGGQGRRLGGRDKSLIELNGFPLWAHVSKRLRPMTDKIVVTGRQAPDWAIPKNEVAFIPDALSQGEPVGPAGGLLAALEFGKAQFDSRALVLTVPVDVPFFPLDLLAQLDAGRGAAAASIAITDKRVQPAFGLWRCALAPKVRLCVQNDELAMRDIARSVEAAGVSFANEHDEFLNLNTQGDIQKAEQLVAQNAYR